MKDFLNSIEWNMIGYFLLMVLFFAAVIGLGFFARLVLLPAVGAFWAFIIVAPVALAMLLGFLELILRY